MLKKIWLSRLHSGELSDSMDSCSTQSDADHPASPLFVQAVPSTTMLPNTMTTATESSIMSRAPPLMSTTTTVETGSEYASAINYSRYSPLHHQQHHLVSMPGYHHSSHPHQQRASTSSTSSTPPLQHLQDLSSYSSMPSPSSSQGHLEGHPYLDHHHLDDSRLQKHHDSHALHAAGHSTQDEPLNLVCTVTVCLALVTNNICIETNISQVQ